MAFNKYPMLASVLGLSTLILSVHARWDVREGRGCNKGPTGRYPKDVYLCGGDQRTQLQCKQVEGTSNWALQKMDTQCSMEETCRSTTVIGAPKADIPDVGGDGPATEWTPWKSGDPAAITCNNFVKPPKGFDNPFAWGCPKIGDVICDGDWAWECDNHNRYQDKAEMGIMSPGMETWPFGNLEWTNLKYCSDGCKVDNGKTVCDKPVFDLAPNW